MCAAQRPAEEEAVQRRVVRAAEVVRGEAGAPIILLLVLVAAVNLLAVSTSSTVARAPGALGRGQLGAVLMDEEHVPAGWDDELEPAAFCGSGAEVAFPVRRRDGDETTRSAPTVGSPPAGYTGGASGRPP